MQLDSSIKQHFKRTEQALLLQQNLQTSLLRRIVQEHPLQRGV